MRRALQSTSKHKINHHRQQIGVYLMATPPQWGAAAARYIGKPKGGLTPNQLYRVICLSFDGENLTVKNGYGKEQIAPASSFIKPHDKPPKNQPQ